MKRPLARVLFAQPCVALTACGGGGGGGGDGRSEPAPLTAFGFSGLELAQTHVLPQNGKSWSLPSATESLQLVGKRNTLALVRLAQADAIDPVLEAWVGSAKLGAVALQAPNFLPPTEDNGPAYGSDRYSATLPAAWMRPLLELRVHADNYTASAFRDVSVGADMPLTMRILPFYLFGADNADRPYAQTAKPDAATVAELFEKWPVATLMIDTHPAQRANWPHLVIGPTGSAAAYVMHSSDDAHESFQVLGTLHGVVGDLMSANGDSPQNVQYYAPVIQQNAAGAYRGPGGGVGGGDRGTGDDAYRGVFIHEQGHALSLPHAGGAYDAGKYPYGWGSLKGSAWGYDATRRRFLAPFVPVTADTFTGCASDTYEGHARAIDGANRCVKQDPMQSGSGDQADGARFTMSSDFNAGKMQRYMEENYVVADSGFTGGYRRWNRATRTWDAYTPVTTNNAQYGFNGGFPVQRDVPVHAIALSISKAGTPGATQIYPPLAFTGNLVRNIDPRDPDQRAEIQHYKSGGTGPGRWYCADSGCDYTVRVRYANATERYVLLQGAFRAFDDPAGAFRTGATTATSGASFASYAINVPADAAISRIDLYETPTAWRDGLPVLLPLASYVAP